MTPVSSTETPGPGRQRLPRGQGDRLRDEILDAAEALLLSGADERTVSIRSVSAAVGVSPPAIYRHFTDKDELLLAVCEKAFAGFDERVQAAAGNESDPLLALRRLGEAYIQFAREHPEHYRILFLKHPGEAGRRGAERGGGTGLVAFSHLVEAVARCIQAGRLPEQDPARAALVLWAAVHGLASLLILMPYFPWPSVPELVQTHLDVQLQGLASQGP